MTDAHLPQPRPRGVGPQEPPAEPTSEAEDAPDFGARFIEALQEGGHALGRFDYAEIQRLKAASRSELVALLAREELPSAWRRALRTGDLERLRSRETPLEHVERLLGPPGEEPFGERFARALRISSGVVPFNYAELQSIKRSDRQVLAQRFEALAREDPRILEALRDGDAARAAIAIEDARQVAMARGLAALAAAGWLSTFISVLR